MRTIWILVVILAVVSVARADEDAEKVVKKAVEAHGGEKTLLAYKAAEMSFTMKVKSPGLEYECKADMAYSIPDKYKITIVGEVGNEKITLVQSVNGTKVSSTVNGVVKKLRVREEAELKDSIRTQEMCMIAPLLDKTRYTLKAERDAKIGNTETAVVTVTAKEMKDTKLFFDKKTGLLIRMQRLALDPEGDDSLDEVTDMSDYRKVDGVQTPMTLKVLHDGKLYMTGKVTQMKYYEKLDDKKFRIGGLKEL